MKKTLLTILLAASAMGTAQMTTGTTNTATQLVNDVLLGNSTIITTNVTSSSGINFGATNSLGSFSYSGSNFPFQNGIILSTGDVANAPGPNTSTQSTNGWGGDADLENFIEFSPGASSQNATSLTFDFVAPSNYFSFDYIFASEEYGFNQCDFGDAFAIILTDLGTGVTENIALIPGTTTPVSVTTVRDSQYNSNCASMNAAFFGEYYTSANTSAPVNFNGVTIPLSAAANVVPGNTYRLKIVIADRADGVFDSALFIQGGSFDTTPLETTLQPSSSNGYILCEGGSTVLSVTANPAYTYAWSTGAAGNSLTVNEAGTYTVTVAELGNTIQTFTFTILDTEATLITDGSICVDYETGEVLEPYLLDTGLEGNYTFTWSYNGVLVPGVTGSSYMATMEGGYQVIATDVVSGCQIMNNVTVTLSSPASITNTGYTINNQTVTINVTGYGEYVYQLDGGTVQESNVFTNLDYGTHIINVINVDGCGSMSLTIQITMPDAPDGMSEQTFTPGQTLADLEVDGENIQWYATAGSETGRNTNDNDEAPLPLTTLLEDNTTYYASQTINGVESIDRLPVTVHAALEVAQNIFAGLKVYPNPVKDVIKISNNESIDTLVIYNLMGQVVYRNILNATASLIDISSLAKGVYTITLTSEGKETNIKIIKE